VLRDFSPPRVGRTVCLIACACGACGADWPQWGGRDERNMVALEKGLPDCFEPGTKRPDGTGIDPQTTRNVRWTARLGSQTYGNPTVAGGRVFIGTNDFALNDPKYHASQGGVLKCFQEATGRLLWQLIVPRTEIDTQRVRFDNMDLGICSSPTVDGDRVYLVTNRCEVACLDLEGRPQWQFDMISRLPVCPHDAANCSILVHGGLLYVGTSNGVPHGGLKPLLPLAPTMIVLDKKTGRLVAQDDERIGTRLWHGQWSSPCLAHAGGRTLVVYGGGDGVCYAFAPAEPLPRAVTKLKKVWSFDCNPPRYKFAGGKPIDYWSGDIRRRAGNSNDGTFVGPSEIIATPVFYRNRIYVAVGQDPRHGRGRGILHSIDAAKTGDISESGRLWSYDKLDRTLSTASLADGLLYIADFNGALHCLDAQTGACYWVHQTNAETWGSTLVADGKVYLGTKKSFWVLAAGKELKVLHEMHLGAPVWCTPIAANGVLYVASEKYLWAVERAENGTAPRHGP
jgi:outer membrane protein assembly factor BamB